MEKWKKGGGSPLTTPTDLSNTRVSAEEAKNQCAVQNTNHLE